MTTCKPPLWDSAPGVFFHGQSNENMSVADSLISRRYTWADEAFTWENNINWSIWYEQNRSHKPWSKMCRTSSYVIDFVVSRRSLRAASWFCFEASSLRGHHFERSHYKKGKETLNGNNKDGGRRITVDEQRWRGSIYQYVGMFSLPLGSTRSTLQK